MEYILKTYLIPVRLTKVIHSCTLLATSVYLIISVFFIYFLNPQNLQIFYSNLISVVHEIHERLKNSHKGNQIVIKYFQNSKEKSKE